MQYQNILQKIAAAAVRSHRDPANILVLPVSKTQPIQKLQELYDLGIRDFAENRVQELTRKKEELPSDVHWHFIGNLQTNKVKYLAPFVQCVHSVHSRDLADELSKRAALYERTIEVLIEANISQEAQKHGAEPTEIEAIARHIFQNCPNLVLKGLMGMASFEDDPERTRPQFRTLRTLRDDIQTRHPEWTRFTELSMGMSNDFEVAVEEGATIVRIGTALFQG